MSNHDPLDQLSAFRSDVDAKTRSRHLDAIEAELETRSPALRRDRRRWTLGVVVAMLVAGPVAAAASNDAVPGDVLYPIKLAVEPIVRLFDPDVRAEHRVEEVAELVDRRSEDILIEERIGVARDALAETDTPELARDLDRIVDRWEGDRRTLDPAIDEPTPTSEPPRDDAPRDRSDVVDETAPEGAAVTTTTTVPADQPRDTPPVTDGRGNTTTSTAPVGDDTEPPPDDRPRDEP